MKKALALVLALVLALSMAVSAFALVALEPVEPDEDEPTKIFVVDLKDDDEGENEILYTRPAMPFWNRYYETELTDTYVTYFALDNRNYKDIKLTANGNLDAELVEFDLETMDVENMEITYKVLKAGKNVGVNVGTKEEPEYLLGDYTAVKADKTMLEAYWEVVEADKKAGLKDDPNYVTDYPELVAGCIPTNGLTYKEAKLVKDFLKDYDKVTTYGVDFEQYVNIIKLTVENNFSAHYTEGTLKIEAKLDKEAVEETLTVINDVAIFEYEEVKYAADNNEDGVTLQLGAAGYSDYVTDEWGYGPEYNENVLRNPELYALVVSTTAFRAIEGKDLTLDVLANDDMEISVTLKEVAKGQKGVNFFAWGDYTYDDRNEDEEFNGSDDFETISFGFMGDQVVKGKFEIVVDLPIDYYELRELFGEKVEEEDIISYYVYNQNNEVVKTIKVDYMTFDPSENVEFTIEGENEKLGWYTLALDVPAAEVEGEENPNTGAESVVGVVAALAVVSLASAAAVSLKK